jgi:Icc protein
MSSARLIQCTDLHLFATPDAEYRGVVSHASLGAVLSAARAQHWPADALLLTGDLVDDESAAGYALLQTLVAPLAVPVLAIAGNHDDRHALAALNRGAFRVGGTHRVGAWQVILLQTQTPGEVHGTLDAPQRRMLSAALQREPARPTLIALHHPPLAVGSRWVDALGLRDADALWDIIAPHPQVKAVVFGHAHQEHDSVHQGVRCLGTPATCVQFQVGSAEFALDPTLAPGYRWFDLHDDGGLITGVERIRI